LKSAMDAGPTPKAPRVSKRNGPNYVLTSVDVPKQQNTAPPVTVPSPLDTKTDEHVTAPLDKGGAPAVLPQVERGGMNMGSAAILD
jgi:hypothetical protein